LRAAAEGSALDERAAKDLLDRSEQLIAEARAFAAAG
jgi:hypothetical protein